MPDRMQQQLTSSSYRELMLYIQRYTLLQQRHILINLARTKKYLVKLQTKPPRLIHANSEHFLMAMKQLTMEINEVARHLLLFEVALNAEREAMSTQTLGKSTKNTQFHSTDHVRSAEEHRFNALRMAISTMVIRAGWSTEDANVLKSVLLIMTASITSLGMAFVSCSYS